MQPHLTERLGQFRIFVDALALFPVTETVAEPEQDDAARVRQQHDPVLRAPKQRQEADRERQCKQPRREPSVRWDRRKIDGFGARRILSAPAALGLQALERQIAPRIGRIGQDADEQQPDRPERHVLPKVPHKDTRHGSQHEDDAERPLLPPETGKMRSNVRIGLKFRWDRHADGQIFLEFCIVDQHAHDQRRNPQHAQP